MVNSYFYPWHFPARKSLAAFSANLLSHGLIHSCVPRSDGIIHRCSGIEWRTHMHIIRGVIIPVCKSQIRTREKIRQMQLCIQGTVRFCRALSAYAIRRYDLYRDLGELRKRRERVLRGKAGRCERYDFLELWAAAAIIPIHASCVLARLLYS